MTELKVDNIIYCSIMLSVEDVTRLVKMGIFVSDRSGRVKVAEISKEKESLIGDIVTGGNAG